MMGAAILVVGLIGVIQAITIGSELQATARRQTMGAQIINNEIELLRLKDWSTLQALASTAYSGSSVEWNSSTTYAVGNLVSHAGAWYTCTSANTNSIPPNAAYWSPATWSAATAYAVGNSASVGGLLYTCITANTNQMPPNTTYWVGQNGWNPATNYNVTDVVNVSGTWYRCITTTTSNQPVTNTTYWATYSGPIASTGIYSGATYSLMRTFATLPNGLIEVTFTVQWTVKPSGISVSRTYTRISTAYFGKYGLSLTYQRT